MSGKLDGGGFGLGSRPRKTNDAALINMARPGWHLLIISQPLPFWESPVISFASQFHPCAYWINIVFMCTHKYSVMVSSV